MSDFKISIIMPVYNSEKFLKESLDSIVNQSIGIQNLEVIIVDDASTDRTKDILDEYSAKYSNFKVIHLKENIGAAYGPRNVALKEVTGDYVMFLDADDTFTPQACEILYDEITSKDVDMVFGRYFRVYKDFKLKSYSPYSDDFNCPNDLEYNPNFNGIISFLWSKIFYRIMYGKAIKSDDKVLISDIRKNPEILKILPSLWTRIIKTSKIKEFPPLITGEDLNLILDVYRDSEVVFLNTSFITNYSMRFDEEELSITKNINFKLVLDSIRAYRLAIEKSRKYAFCRINKMINPFLLNYLMLLRQENFNSHEKRILKEEVIKLDNVYDDKGLFGFLIVKMIKFLS